MRFISLILMALAAVAVAQDCCEDPPGCGCPDFCSGVSDTGPYMGNIKR